MSPAWTTARQVRHQLEYGSVWQDRDSIENYDGLVRAIRNSDTERREFVEAVAHCLTDENLLVRSGAVAVLGEVAAELGATRIHTIYQRSSGLFRDVPPAVTCGIKALEEGIAQAIAKVVTVSDTAAIQYLREAAYSPWGKALLFRLAAVDGDWLLEHAEGLIPSDYIGVLIPLTPEQRRKLIAKIGPFTCVPTEYYWKQFPSAEAEELKGLLTGQQ